jgi:hypothetical protein
MPGDDVAIPADGLLKPKARMLPAISATCASGVSPSIAGEWDQPVERPVLDLKAFPAAQEMPSPWRKDRAAGITLGSCRRNAPEANVSLDEQQACGRHRKNFPPIKGGDRRPDQSGS